MLQSFTYFPSCPSRDQSNQFQVGNIFSLGGIAFHLNIVNWKYWISSLMICIQRNLVQGIRDRCINIYRRNFDETYESRHDVIVDIDHLRV